MKLIRLAMILVIAVTALGMGTTSAQAAGKFTYMSSILVQNLDSVAGNITVTFYKQDGTSTSKTYPIAANGKVDLFPLNDVEAGFNGSVVITSETNVASVSNVHGGKNGNVFFASGAYVAQSAGDTTISIPLLMKGNGDLDTWFNIQNAGSADATVDIDYTNGTDLPDVVIPKGAAKTFDQATETHTAKVFAATVTSDQPIVITVVEESTNILYAYNGFTTGGGTTNPVFPLVHFHNSGYFSAINLQNQGTDATDVTITYTPSTKGVACTEKQTIPAGENKIFGFVFETTISGATSDCLTKNPKTNTWIGSAVVTGNSSSNNLVAVVNQWNGTINGGAYNGFNTASATGKVVLPLVFDHRGASGGNTGYWTSAGFRNVGDVATTITCTFTPPTGSTTPIVITIPSSPLAPGEGYTHFHFNVLGANNYLGSASCVANASGAKIIAIVNELGPNTTADELLVYEGINAAP